MQPQQLASGCCLPCHMHHMSMLMCVKRWWGGMWQAASANWPEQYVSQWHAALDPSRPDGPSLESPHWNANNFTIACGAHWHVLRLSQEFYCNLTRNKIISCCSAFTASPFQALLLLAYQCCCYPAAVA